MPVEEGLGAISRLLGWLLRSLLFEFVLEVAVRGLGYAICRVFTRRVEPTDWLSLFVGVLAWLAILSGAWYLFLR